MLKLIYTPTLPGPPAVYGTAEDTLAVRTDAGERELQRFRKAGPEFIAPNAELGRTIDTWLATRTNPALPVIVMVHGYLYDPRANSPDSPFTTVYSTPGARPFNLSWLPLVGECDINGTPQDDNAIAFVYQSESRLADYAAAGWNNSYQFAVFDQSPLAGRALAAILAHLGTHAGITVRVLAHSLGTRTTSQAVGRLGPAIPANIDRMVLLDGAEFSIDAAAHFKNCTFDVFNILSRSDKVLNLGGDEMCHPFRPNNTRAACVIGRDGLGANTRWLDLRIDDPVTRAWFAGRHAPGGATYAIDPTAEEPSHPNATLGHWACYTNVGNRSLVRDLLFAPAMTVANFTANGVPPVTECPSNGLFNGEAIPPIPDDWATRHATLNPRGGAAEQR